MTSIENNLSNPGAIARAASWVTRLYPLYSGCGTLANSALARRISRGRGVVAARVRGGGIVLADLGDYVGRPIFFFGDLDPKVTWVVRRLLRPGDTALDIGSNCGLVSVIAASIVGDRGRVVAFEPQPRLAEAVRSAGRLNGFPRLEVHQIALTDSSGSLELHTDGDNSGAASVAARGGAGGVVQVRGEPIDQFFRAIGVGAARVMKVDVEGHEASVFRGARAYLRATPPDAIVFESHSKKPLAQRDEAKELLDAGYRIAAIPRFLVRPSLQWCRGEDAPPSHDYVALHTCESGREAAARLGLTMNG
jgi:FkbM family methyltransferase